MSPFKIVGRICRGILWAHSKSLVRGMSWAHSKQLERSAAKSYGPIHTHRERLSGNVLGPFEKVGRICREILWAHSNPSGVSFWECLELIHKQSGGPAARMIGPSEIIGRILQGMSWAHSKQLEGSATKSYGPIQTHRERLSGNALSPSASSRGDLPQECLGPSEIIGRILQGMSWAHSKQSEGSAAKSYGCIHTHQERLSGNVLGPFKIIKSCNCKIKWAHSLASEAASKTILGPFEIIGSSH